MKSILNLFFVMLLMSCNTKTEKSNPSISSSEKSSSKEVTPAKPCELFGKEQLADVFNIQAKSTIEMYVRENGMNTNQCQFLWQEAEGSREGSQVMIDISHKTADMGATFSRMLELDLQNGLSASEKGKIINIKPSPIQNFGDFAYHWTQPNNSNIPGLQNVHVIKFQVQNNYAVKITYNSTVKSDIPAEEIISKLKAIGKVIQQKIN